MSPDSAAAELVAGIAAVLAAVALGLLWNRLGGWRQILVRSTVGVLCVVTAGATAAAWVNRQVDFLPAWSGGTAAAAAGPVQASDPGGGHMLTFTVAGAASRLTLPMYAYVPPGYQASGTQRYPVIEALHGYPGTPKQWLHVLDAARVLDREILAGRMAPTIVLFPYQTPDPLLDTECTNLTHGPQTETFLTRDVPAFARTHLRVRTDQAGWGLIGYSAGGYCAADLLLRHPGQYAAGAALSGYADPGIHVGDGSEHTTYNDVWRLRNLPVPAVALYLSCANADQEAYKATREVARAVHGPISLTTSYITGGGHSMRTWKAMEAPAFDWLSTWLGRATSGEEPR